MALEEARHGARIAGMTTLRVGGPARDFLEAADAASLAAAAREADARGEPLLVLGGGSNVLVADDGFPGLVLRPVGEAVEDAGPDGRGGRLVDAWAGTDWDRLVETSVERGLAGLEALSGIPGKIGSAVMQNLGAYGQEAGARLVSAVMLDRRTGETGRYGAGELALGYRTSMLRASLEEGAWGPTPRWVVLSARFSLDEGGTGRVSHTQLARALGRRVGDEMPAGAIREAVLAVRASKGMVRDPDPEGPAPDHDRWSSGSFFTNPVLDAEAAERALPPEAPRYPAGKAGAVKTSAAWLIEHAGFPRGFGVHGEGSAATLSRLHTLALTNRGGAAARDVAELARAVRDGVEARFGVRLEPETVLVGVEL